jgi:hypothetical protein
MAQLDSLHADLGQAIAPPLKSWFFPSFIGNVALE